MSVPVHVFRATRSDAIPFRLLAEDGTPLSRRYYCPKDHHDVPREHLVRGYETESGDFVIVNDDELEALEPRKTRDIDLRQFVDAAQIPPLYFERGYYLTPAGESAKAYRLLAAIMERNRRASSIAKAIGEHEAHVAPHELRDPYAEAVDVVVIDLLETIRRGLHADGERTRGDGARKQRRRRPVRKGAVRGTGWGNWRGLRCRNRALLLSGYAE